MRKVVPTEHAEQSALMQRVRLHEARYPALKMLAAVPNGARVAFSTARKLKREGMKSGVPDLILFFPAQGFHGLAIELKSLTGTASKEQKDWIERLNANGYRAEVCRGHEAAWKVIADYLSIP